MQRLEIRTQLGGQEHNWDSTVRLVVPEMAEIQMRNTCWWGQTLPGHRSALCDRCAYSITLCTALPPRRFW